MALLIDVKFIASAIIYVFQTE